MSLYGSPSQPDFAAAVAKVQGLSKEQLQELLNDEDKFEVLIRDLDQIKNLYAEKEMLMASNKSLAEYNLSQEPVLKAARSKLQEKHREAMRMAEKVKELKREVDEKSNKVEPDTLLALLQAANAEAEDESERVAEDFLSKRNENIDDFIETFMEKRKIAHLRRVKIEKMRDLLDSQRRTPSTTPSRRAPPPPSAASMQAPPYSGVQASSAALPSPAVYNLPAPVAAPSNSWAAFPPASQPAYSSANLPYPINPVGMPLGPGY